MLRGHYPASQLVWAPPTPGAPRLGYVFPAALGSTHAHGSPRFLVRLSMRAVPNHPGGPGSCMRSLLHPRYQASASLAAWPPASCVTRPNRVHLRYGSHLRLGRLRRLDLSTGCPGPGILRTSAAPSATYRASDSHGELLSVHKSDQASPGAPEARSRREEEEEEEEEEERLGARTLPTRQSVSVVTLRLCASA